MLQLYTQRSQRSRQAQGGQETDLPGEEHAFASLPGTALGPNITVKTLSHGPGSGAGTAYGPLLKQDDL